MTSKGHFTLPKIKVPTVNLYAFNKIRETTNHISNYAQTIDRLMAGLQNRFYHDFLKNHHAIMNVANGLADAMQGTVKNPVAKKVLRERGILPHKSTPWNLFDPNKPDEFADAVLSYYSTEWNQACAVFQTDLDAYQISEDAKEAFNEGIKCHTFQLYRPTILTVLPAAETEFRRTFEIAPNRPSTTLKELREAVLEAPADMTLRHVAPFDLFKILDKHLYENVRTQEDLEILVADPIPNRHAAIHGLIQYKSELSSLNALILTDYVFFLISQIAHHLKPGE